MLDQLTRERDEARAEADSLREHDSASEKVDSLVSEIKNLELELEGIRTERAAHESMVDELTRERDEARGECEALRGAASSTDRINELTEENEIIQLELDSLKTERAAHEAVVKELTQERDAARGLAAAGAGAGLAGAGLALGGGLGGGGLGGGGGSDESSDKDSSDDKASASGQAEELMEEIENLQLELEAIKKERDEARGECEQLREAAGASAKVDSLVDEIKTLELELEGIKTERAAHESIVEELTRERDEARSEADALRQLSAGTRERVDELVGEVQTLELELEGIKTERASHQSIADELTRERDAARTEGDAATKQVDDLSKALGDANAELASLRATLETARGERDEAIEEAEDLRDAASSIAGRAADALLAQGTTRPGTLEGVLELAQQRIESLKSLGGQQQKVDDAPIV
jgi:chromosome segregation ATPase